MEATQGAQQRSSGDPRRATRWFAGAGIIYAGMLAATWAPQRGRGGINLVPFVSHIRGIVAWVQGKGSPSLFVDFVVNVLLFMPLTVVLARGFHLARGLGAFARPTIVLGCLGSLVIEVGQLFRPSRTTDITDFLLNSLGVILVVRLFARWGRAHR